jgi:hypothetical protein
VNKRHLKLLPAVLLVMGVWFPALSYAINALDINTGQLVKLIDYTNLRTGFTISYLDYAAGEIRYGVVQDIIIVQPWATIYVFDSATDSVREFYIENFNITVAE